MNHIESEAELYALGMLDDDERARIDEHLRTCEACAQLVGRAESALTALVDATQRAPQRRLARWPLAVAAAFTLASAGLLQQNLALHATLEGDGAIFDRMIDSHFDHVQFQTPHGAALAAKAVYERHGAWYEILASGTPAWRVVLVRPDGSRVPAAAGFVQRGGAAIMTLAPASPVRAIELDDAAGRLVGSATPTLQGEPER
jgi:hypothetical protein